MEIKKGYIYIVDLNPRIGTEAGKVRPVVVVQTDLLNGIHPSTIVCPITTRVKPKAQFLRIHLTPKEGGLKTSSDIMVDQIRAIDNKRFLKQTGRISHRNLVKLNQNLKIILS